MNMDSLRPHPPKGAEEPYKKGYKENKGIKEGGETQQGPIV